MIDIKQLFETHVEVSDLETSIAFYEKLGLPLARRFATFAFFWIGHDRRMLGIWEKKDRSVVRQHFAFSVDLESLLAARQVLLEEGIRLIPAFGKEPVEPIVHTWQPAVSLYFADPDGNSLEFICELQDPPSEPPRVVYYSEWLELQGRANETATEQKNVTTPTPIQTLYETHLEVADLERSIAFYEKLGLPLARRFDTFAFFWLGSTEEPARKMLGVWQITDRDLVPQHTAFEVELDALLAARQVLQDNGIEPVRDFGKEPIEPVVHTWMPAASLYFKDPDGNLLEYISLLDSEPAEPMSPPYYSEWVAMQTSKGGVECK